MPDNKQEHRARPWRVNDLARDFELLDVWRFECQAPVSLDEFLRAFWQVARELEQSSLARLRSWLGRKFKWDDHDFTLSIPGCAEKRVSERLTDADRERNRASADRPPLQGPTVETVYQFADEALFELSNDTVHALLHVGVPGESATLAVYIKSRGLFTRAYLLAISPFRHAVIYPRLIRRVEAILEKGASDPEQSVSPADAAGA